MLPENPEVTLKLAGVLFQESGTDADIEQSQQLLARLIEKEPDNAEAHLLQGKIFHRLTELPQAIAALEKAIQIQGEDST
jgi:cytochrome c-type biogenesis protein CcmH/NrfG